MEPLHTRMVICILRLGADCRPCKGIILIFYLYVPYKLKKNLIKDI